MKQEHTRRSRFLTPAAVVVAWMLVWGCVRSTTLQAAEQPKPPPQTGRPGPPVAIADSEIIPRAEQTVKSLQKIRSEVTADPTLKSIERDFAGLAEKSDQRHERDVETISKSRSVQHLNEILREWSLEQSQLEAWDQALAKRSQILVAQQKDNRPHQRDLASNTGRGGKEIFLQSGLGAKSRGGFARSPSHTPGRSGAHDKVAEAARSGGR
ncbi:MAG: hypothetical protein ACREQ2_09850 [Candidatus Binatia bacterium]